MKIKDARRLQQEPSPRGFCTLLRFSLQVSDDLTIHECTLVRAPDGRVLVYGPASKTGGALISMSPSVRQTIIEQADQAMGITLNAKRAA